MDILGALAPRGPVDWSRRPRRARRHSMGCFGMAVNYARIESDSVMQSERLYRLFNSTVVGGVVTNEQAARALVNHGFAVEETMLTREEQDYLSSRLPEVVDNPRVWFTTCSDPAGVILNYCGPPPGLKEIDAQQAMQSGAVTVQDMAAMAWVPKENIKGIKVFQALLSAYTPQQFSLAVKAVNHYDEIAKLVLDIEGRAERTGFLLEEQQQAVSAARVYLAVSAQPVAIFRERFPEYVGPAIVKQERLGELATASIVLICIAVMVVSIAGAVVYLGSLGERQYDGWTELKAVHQAQAQQLVDCVSNMSLSREQRWACNSALRELRKLDPEQPTDPLASVAKAIQGLAPVLTIGVGAYFFGPIIVEMVKTGSEAMRKRRQVKARQRSHEEAQVKARQDLLSFEGAPSEDVA